MERTDHDSLNNAAGGRSGLRSRAIANHMAGSSQEQQTVTMSTVWSGYPQWMAGCLARLYQSEDLCDVTLDVGLRTVSNIATQGCQQGERVTS